MLNIDPSLIEDIPQCVLDCATLPRWSDFVRTISNRTWLRLEKCDRLPDVLMSALDPAYTPSSINTSSVYTKLSKFAHQMTSNFNPLKIKDNTNKVLSFKRLQDFYRATLNLIFQQFPEGEINLKKFLHANTAFSDTLIDDIIRDATPLIRLDLGGQFRDTISVDWHDYLDPRRKLFFVLQYLCYVATEEEDFDRNGFFEAYIDFYFTDTKNGCTE